MKGAIRHVTREYTEDRANTTVSTAWIHNGLGERAWSGGSWLDGHGAPSLPNDASPILLMLGADEAADETLSRYIRNGVRTYVLVDPDIEIDFDLASKTTLIRRVPEVPVSAIHSANENRVWIGGGHSLKLEGQQAEALRQTFLRLFWHEATEEAWVDGRQCVWRPARERPFDVPEVAASAAVRWEAPDARFSLGLRDACVHLSDGEPPSVAPRRLWFRAGGAHHLRLAKLMQEHTEVVWDELGLPDLAVTESGGEALLPGTHGRLRIRLTPAQAQEFGRLLGGEASWTFHANVRIGDPRVRQASFWLADENAARSIEAQQCIDVPTVSATSIRGVHTTAPSSWPTPQPLALSTLYRWSVAPPRVPAGSEEDPLVKHWNHIDNDWNKRLAAVGYVLKNSDGERSRIGKAFPRLFRDLVGFERRYQELLHEVSTLASERPSTAGPSGAPGLLSRLDKLEESAKKHQGDLDDAERTAREQDERERQEAEWTKQIEQAKLAAAAAREELAKAEDRERELADEAKEIEAGLQEAESDKRKDLKVLQKRNNDERKKHTDRLRKARYDLKKHLDDTTRPFTFNASKLAPRRQQPQGKRFVPTAAPSRSSSKVPGDALPEVGSLRTHQGQRYLVIDVWEHLDAGEQVASRLSAKLVAPEKV